MSGNERRKLREIEVRVIVELMRDSHRSDRELAKAVGTSQPTISRIKKRLEDEGVIKEYTIIPDFKRLGYQLMGITLIRRQEETNKEQIEKLRKAIVELEKDNPYASLMAVNGMGLGKNTAFITFYRDYARYAEAMNLTRNLPFIEVGKTESFLVDLNDETNYRILTLGQVAHNIQTFAKISEGKSPEQKI